MSPGEGRPYSEFPPIRGLWAARPLSECGELLAHLGGLGEVPIGILLLCMLGMREAESWYVRGGGPRRTVRMVRVSNACRSLEGPGLVRALQDVEAGGMDVTSWVELCAVTLWSELCGAQVECLWTEEALAAVLADPSPEARFFPWTSPAWRHSAAERSFLSEETVDAAMRRGLNPALARGLHAGPASAALAARHFERARRLLCLGRAVFSEAGSAAEELRLDRYFGAEATESALGVVCASARFRVALFGWLHDAQLDDDELLLALEALLHLREDVECRAVSCNSFLFRWRTRTPFSYQLFTLGQLRRIVTLAELSPAPSFRPAGKVLAAGIETRRFTLHLQDGNRAAGEVTRVRPQVSGSRVVPDIAVPPSPERLSAIVRRYERASGRPVLVAVNGGYFLDSRSTPPEHPEWLGRPMGLLKTDGRFLAGPFVSARPVLCLDPQHGVGLRRVVQGLFDRDEDEAPLARAYAWSDDAGEYAGWRAALEAGPLLVEGGRVVLDLDREQWGSGAARHLQAAPVEMADLRTARTALCVCAGGDVHLVTVFGRVPESVGLTHRELADWILREIPQIGWAMEMDAGGSVAAWHRGRGTITPGAGVDAVERPIGSAILFALDG